MTEFIRHFAIFLLVILLFCLGSVTSINFGDASPDTGEADMGWHTGNYAAIIGSANDTRTLNNIFFAVRRGNGVSAVINQTLAFNIGTFSTNSSIKITGINGSLAYCHARRGTSGCNGGDNPQGSAGTMNLVVQNATGSSFYVARTIPATSTNTRSTILWGLDANSKLSDFINSTGFINVYFGFVWSGTGQSAFLDDYAPITIRYDVKPYAVLVSPANNSAYTGISNVTFNCSATDDNGLANVTLYHNINGSFIANQTANITGTSNSSRFNVTGITPGTYIWNCLVSDSVTGSRFTSPNFTFTVLDNTAPSVAIVPPTPANNTNQTASSVLVNATSADTYSSISSCILNFGGENFTMIKSGSGTNVSCYFNNTGIVDGTYTYKVYSNDNSSNIGVSAPRTITIDSTSPTITFVPPSHADGATIGISRTYVNTTVTDTMPISGCLINWNGTNQTMNMSGSGNSVFCYFNKTGLADATYYYIVYANDSLGNLAASATRTLTVSSSAPDIHFVPPSDYHESTVARSNTYINATIASTTAGSVSACILNWNGTGETMSMAGTGTSVVCYANKTGLSDGSYTYNITANDTLGNTGNSGNRIITIDTTAPTSSFASPTPDNGITQAENSVTINISAADALSSISACAINWNSTNQTMFESSSGSSIYCYFHEANLNQGTYSYTAYSNDSVGNLGATETRTVTIDYTGPAVDFASPTPGNGENSSSSSIILSAGITDAFSSISSCVLEWNGTNETIDITGSGASVTCTGSKNALESGTYTYRVYANDTLGNLNVSETRTITIDTNIPNFISLTTSPASEHDLDPGVIVNVIGNITDNTTSVVTAVLQYRLSDNETYANLTMSFNSTTSLFNASFNATEEGSYVLRFFAIDSAGNSAFSNTETISVYWERTWEAEIEGHDAVAATASQNLSIGIIKLNNTADVALNFSIGSDYSNTAFNVSFPLSIPAGEVRHVNVTAIAPAVNSATTVLLTVNATPDGSPAEHQVHLHIIVEDDAFLSAGIITYPKTVTKGDTNVFFTATIENVGHKNATNVTFYYVLPANWTVTGGEINISLGDVMPGYTLYSSIEVTIGTDAEAGVQTIIVNTTGNNQSGSSLRDMGNVVGEHVSVTVNEAAVSLGAAEAPAVTTSSGGGGGGGGTAYNCLDECRIEGITQCFGNSLFECAKEAGCLKWALISSFSPECYKEPVYPDVTETEKPHKEESQEPAEKAEPISKEELEKTWLKEHKAAVAIGVAATVSLLAGFGVVWWKYIKCRRKKTFFSPRKPAVRGRKLSSIHSEPLDAKRRKVYK